MEEHEVRRCRLTFSLTLGLEALGCQPVESTSPFKSFGFQICQAAPLQGEVADDEADGAPDVEQGAVGRVQPLLRLCAGGAGDAARRRAASACCSTTALENAPPPPGLVFKV